MKSRKLRILIVITFIFALILTLFSLLNSTTRSEELPETGHTIYWPRVYDDEFNKSIISYDGAFDTDIFEEEFESQFNYEIENIEYEVDPDFEYDKDDYELYFEYNDENMYVTAVNNLGQTMDLTNPGHTYKYKLVSN